MHVKGWEAGGLCAVEITQGGTTVNLFFIVFCSGEGARGDLHAQAVGATRWHETCPSSIAKERRISQKNDEGGKGTHGSTPPSSPTAEAECKINFAHTEMAVQEGFFALERLMGKLNPADAGGMNATFQFAY